MPDRQQTGDCLAIVGSVHFANPEAWKTVDEKISAAIEWLRPAFLVSGGAKGVDSRAREIGSRYGYTLDNGKFIEYLPANPRWEPNGYRARNLQIAQRCTHLLALRCHQSRTYGSGWTADRAEALGKTVWIRKL